MDMSESHGQTIHSAQLLPLESHKNGSGDSAESVATARMAIAPTGEATSTSQQPRSAVRPGDNDTVEESEGYVPLSGRVQVGRTHADIELNRLTSSPEIANSETLGSEVVASPLLAPQTFPVRGE
jgi:hypothetical protein